ncbi:Putative fatty-acid--CoA ligase FadD21 [Paraburkholderia nemoris]|uniref:fatty acyl-AMP ligase n=1 Tax=Paraburkholderia nemoris TaxID=2793076 RepID=UPI00190CE261|nr:MULTISPECIES: fatty acyl-AMP ligase [Paraburkholderia]MBK3787129.1 fatty acyl-AMP ligase [Paraburkholderia aspalathi]CAE6867231.1 Putative fatty-acid--CoA ligase FadD21 [Paraburkholderia nemoris]
MNFTQLLEQRAREDADQLGYRYLPNDREEFCLTYGQLAAGAHDLAAVIRRHIPPGQRVVLLYPAGLQFIQAFFACLLANVVAVPLPMPKSNDVAHRLDHVIKDCEPAAIFTETAFLEQVGAMLPDAYRAVVATTDGNFDCAKIVRSQVVAEPDVAVLQYTSGSTSKPKGVMLRNANLFANLRQIELAFGHTRESTGVIWLPHYHDMGLVGGILQPLFAGFPVTLLSPISFVQRPLRWLQAIHKYRATTSGGPNFAYDLCVAKAGTLEPHIDLSCWELAFNGAEPVKASTLDAFSATFSHAGFRRSAFVPCYGLAEATLIVAAVPKAEAPLIVESSDSRITARGVSAPTRGQLVSCGQPAEGGHVQILRVDSEEQCREGEVGEVLVHSPSVASGYWGKNDRSFRPGSPAGVRTGDLGFKLGGELFITGRLSDLIVIRGKNFFPEDIEATAQIAEPLLAQEGVAAFSVEGHATEELVLVQEVSSRTLRAVDLIAMRDEVSRLVMQRHGIGVSAFVPVKAGSLVRTSSGKISRFACKQLYVTQKLLQLPM